MKPWLWAWLVVLFFSSCLSGMKRGSDKSLYTIAGILEVKREDAGKSIQLALDQKLFFKMDKTVEPAGEWELVSYEHPPLLLLSETPRVESGYWGLLLQARAFGNAEVKLRFTPHDENQPPKDVTFSISIHH